MSRFHTLLSVSIVALLASSLATAADPPTPVQKQNSALLGVVQQVSAPPQLAGPKTAELIGLIQGTVAPESWVPTAAAVTPSSNASPGALQLIELIQTNVHAPTWDINGGFGTIMIVPW